MSFPLTHKQQQLIDLVRGLGTRNFAPRAAKYDAEASFPFENYNDLKEHGLLALCIPEQYGGLGADFQTYCLVAAEMGRYCGATALTYNMHTCSILWSGILSDDIPMNESERKAHHLRRNEHFRRIVEEGAIYSQPVAEGGPGVSVGQTYGTTARKTDGGWIINGKKIFASLSGAAHYYGILCTEDKPGAAIQDTLYIAVPAHQEGVRVEGDWNPIGMRGTVSRSIIFDNVFVSEQEQLLPQNAYYETTKLWPHMFITLTPTYIGISQAAYDFACAFLRGELEGLRCGEKTQNPMKQMLLAEMYVKLEQSKAIFYQTISEAKFSPHKGERMRAYATSYTVMENANEICRLAIRACGGSSLLKTFPLERYYRDSTCGSLMRPWSADKCIELIIKEALA